MTLAEAEAAAADGGPRPWMATPAGRRPLMRALGRDRAAVVGAVLLLAMVVAVLAAPWLAPADPAHSDVAGRLQPSSWEHPLGTDALGRDTASRLLYGGRASLAMALVATAGIAALGLVMGVVAGMVGGAVDGAVMRAVDVMLALPGLIVAMVTLGVLGRGAVNLVLVVVLLGWPGFARVVRAATLSIRESHYVQAARASGASTARIMARHVAPNLVAPVTVLGTLDLGRILLALSALSYLGFGVDPHQPEWGAMLADAQRYFHAEPRLLVYPGLAISALVFAVNLCGDGLRDVLDRRTAA